MIDEKKISEGAKKIFLASLTFIWGTFFFPLCWRATPGNPRDEMAMLTYTLKVNPFT